MANNADSYTLYQEIKGIYKNSGDVLSKKESDNKSQIAHELLNRIFDEISKPPASVDNSTFLREAYEAFGEDKTSAFSSSEHPDTFKSDINATPLSASPDHSDTFKSDVGILAPALYYKMQDSPQSVDSWLSKDSLFRESYFRYADNTKVYLKLVRTSVEKLAAEQPSSKESPQPPASAPKNPDKNAAPPPQAVKSADAAGRRIENAEEARPKPYDREQARKEWHESQSDVLRKIAEIQPQISESLKALMSFPRDIIELYVLRFAQTQFDLFNNIAEQYRYHHERTEKPNKRDYQNAVENYADFLEMIRDALADFGIEEIRTEPGSPFQASVHEAIQGSKLSAAQSPLVVKESVRSGFRYQGQILQKEQVLLSYSHTGGRSK